MSQNKLAKHCIFLCFVLNFAVATNITYHGGFDRPDCYRRVSGMLDTGAVTLDDPIFLKAPGSGRMVKDNLTLTLRGCEQVCGHQTWYWDIGPRLTTWLIPILLLASNVELSGLDKRRFMAIIHLIGDPIDSFWSLVHKIDAWNQCYEVAKKWEPNSKRRRIIVATIFAAHEEIEGPEITSLDHFDMIAERSGLNTENFVEWARTAVELVDSRTDEFLRSWLAVFLYVWQVVASFVPAIGGESTSPPGGRIGTAMFISWLLPAVLLSNALGSYTSRRSCYNIINRFAQRTNNPPPVLRRKLSLFRGKPLPDPGTDHFEALAWTGGIYTFRPWKTKYMTGRRSTLKTFFMVTLATVPLCFGMIAGFIIVWNTLPTGFNCRHLWMIGIFFAWYFSAFITWVTNSSRIVTGKYHWRFVLVKDALIAVPTIIIIFLSSSGLFNSCYCWSGAFHLGPLARVLLNSDPFYELKDRTLYPEIVGVCITLQICFSFFVLRFWRGGLKVIRWSESVRHEEAEWVRIRDFETARQDPQHISD